MKWFSFFQSYSKKSEFNGTIVIGKRSGQTALFAGGVTQSGGELLPMWQTVVANLQERKPKIISCLVLGVAGGTVINLLHDQFPKLQITAIELDPVMIEVAKENFNLVNDSVTIIITDAISWCQKNTGKKTFDCIIVDLYIGRLNPEKARSSAFLQNLTKLLSDSGLIYYNSHYQQKKPQEFKTFEKTCRSYFKNVEQLYEFPLNKLLCLSEKTTKQTRK